MSAASPGESSFSSFATSLLDLMDRVEYRRVRLSDQFDPVYRLRYEAYRREEFVPINSQQVSTDAFDRVPNAYCFGVYIDGQLVSSVRFHHVTPEESASPCRSMWPEILDPVLDAGHSYIDPSRFTADHEASLAYPALPFLTLRVVAMAAIHFDALYCLAAVRPEHGPFYRRVFQAKQYGEPRSFGELKFLAALYIAEVPKIRESVFSRYPFFMSTAEERRQMFGGSSGSVSPMIGSSARLAARLAEEAA